ncbi:CRISPR-associated helicase Cas3' [candidate division WOR-3 bacterium]|nr:CRISPR-associated helicase Cas3' [candidate division WOR-3 bacterium]
MSEILLAKRPKVSSNPQPQETLLGHSQNVVESFECLFGNEAKPTRFSEQWLRFFELGEIEKFFVNGLAACALHDIGKANSGFQDAVKGAFDAQVIRHEHLSGLLLWLPEIKQWLASIHALDFEILVSSIIGHHLRVKPENFANKLTPDRNRFQLFLNGIDELFEYLTSKLQTDSTPEKCTEECWSFREGNGAFYLWDLREEIKKAMYRFKRKLDDDDSRYRLLLAVRAGLIEADGAGSGLVREGKNIQDWIEEAFHKDLILDGSAVQDKVITPRVAYIQKRNPDLPFKWKTWQEDAGKLSERALLLAPCGSGKTLAAWHWIKARASERPVARVIFLYPTRGTANEGFRDYVGWAPETDAALIHATAAYELVDMFENPEDERHGKDYTTEDRLFALSFWQRRIFSATVDQFLGFMQHSYRSTCLLPLLADSVVVIDEIHSFDTSLFSALKKFLKNFDVPVLCMTASLPAKRSEDMQECGLEIFPKDTKQFAKFQAAAEMPRYAVKKIVDNKEARVIALDAFKAGKRVLWVVNTVERCQNLARELNALCYHSRFKLKDRNLQHKEVVSVFQQEDDRAIAITTQVCEMSLDLDADVLITESTPITSLIQRMGRCNRKAKPGSKKIGKVYVYQPEDIKPYREEELEGSAEFLQKLDGKTVSQARLQELLDELGPGEVEVERYSAFLDSGPWAQARDESLRDIEEFTIQAVLDSDIDTYLKAPTNCKQGFIVPVPRKFAERDSRLPRWLALANSRHYQSKYGFLKTPVEE